jgi:hypothetical protein
MPGANGNRMRNHLISSALTKHAGRRSPGQNRAANPVRALGGVRRGRPWCKNENLGKGLA